MPATWRNRNSPSRLTVHADLLPESTRDARLRLGKLDAFGADPAGATHDATLRVHHRDGMGGPRQVIPRPILTRSHASGASATAAAHVPPHATALDPNRQATLHLVDRHDPKARQPKNPRTIASRSHRSSLVGCISRENTIQSWMARGGIASYADVSPLRQQGGGPYAAVRDQCMAMPFVFSGVRGTAWFSGGPNPNARPVLRCDRVLAPAAATPALIQSEPARETFELQCPAVALRTYLRHRREGLIRRPLIAAGVCCWVSVRLRTAILSSADHAQVIRMRRAAQTGVKHSNFSPIGACSLVSGRTSV
jgi:hypothetical protein